MAGHPGWEYKFFNRAVQEDKEVELVGLIRMARSEPKFEYRGRVGETSNPLYRGFSNQAPEEVQRYDQPVFDPHEHPGRAWSCAAGFRACPRTFTAIDAVIVDDVEAAFFSPVQALLLQKFVSERGGGFLMLGGMQSFREGRLSAHADRRNASGLPRRPVEVPAPAARRPAPSVDPGGSAAAVGPAPRQRGGRARAAGSHARIRGGQLGPRDQARGEPHRHRCATSGARKLRPSPCSDLDAAAAAALMIGDFWRWGLVDDGTHADMDKSWRQMIRWLVSRHTQSRRALRRAAGRRPEQRRAPPGARARPKVSADGRRLGFDRGRSRSSPRAPPGPWPSRSASRPSPP